MPHFLFSFFNGLLDGGDGLIDVGNHSSRHVDRITSTIAQQFDFSELIFLANETGNLVVPMSSPTTISPELLGL